MLVNQEETSKVLRQMVYRLTADRATHEDLIQEALLHLWLREKQRPGQTRSWYLQSCRFCMQDHLRRGRGVNSARPQAILSPFTELEQWPEPCLADQSPCCRSVQALVSAREIVTLLAAWLTPVECEVLDGLVEGYGMRQIAARLNLSHTSVIRYRRRIAALALKFGIEPLPNRKVPRQHCRAQSSRSAR
jgi:DNA-directed RNA polymerase specialized sigma24 family protein